MRSDERGACFRKRSWRGARVLEVCGATSQKIEFCSKEMPFLDAGSGGGHKKKIAKAKKDLKRAHTVSREQRASITLTRGPIVKEGKG
jgi:hypothetical protein